eukprot:COSAG01_NODE_33087_length_570_cov_1.123142_1_plen_74_part_00
MHWTLYTYTHHYFSAHATDGLLKAEVRNANALSLVNDALYPSRVDRWVRLVLIKSYMFAALRNSVLILTLMER